MYGSCDSSFFVSLSLKAPYVQMYHSCAEDRIWELPVRLDAGYQGALISVSRDATLASKALPLLKPAHRPALSWVAYTSYRQAGSMGFSCQLWPRLPDRSKELTCNLSGILAYHYNTSKSRWLRVTWSLRSSVHCRNASWLRRTWKCFLYILLCTV
jgi:hypothetical protein